MQEFFRYEFILCKHFVPLGLILLDRIFFINISPLRGLAFRESNELYSQVNAGGVEYLLNLVKIPKSGVPEVRH